MVQDWLYMVFGHGLGAWASIVFGALMATVFVLPFLFLGWIKEQVEYLKICPRLQQLERDVAELKRKAEIERPK